MSLFKVIGAVFVEGEFCGIPKFSGLEQTKSLQILPPRHVSHGRTWSLTSSNIIQQFQSKLTEKSSGMGLVNPKILKPAFVGVCWCKVQTSTWKSSVFRDLLEFLKFRCWWSEFTSEKDLFKFQIVMICHTSYTSKKM